jgi:peptidoglycan hydrolase-like protein with peptidoglycan-binding domain
MLYRGQRVDKRQTRIVEQSREPVYDQTFEFNLLSILQLAQPLENLGFDAGSNDPISGSNRASAIAPKIASRIQFILLVMDSDQIEKNDVIGKIELNTQHHQKRLFASQMIQHHHQSASSAAGGSIYQNSYAGLFGGKREATIYESGLDEVEGGVAAGGPAAGQFKNNWFDIFYKPGFPVLCTFQINSYC